MDNRSSEVNSGQYFLSSSREGLGRYIHIGRYYYDSKIPNWLLNYDRREWNSMAVPELGHMKVEEL